MAEIRQQVAPFALQLGFADRSRELFLAALACGAIIRGGGSARTAQPERHDPVPNRPLGVVLSERLRVRREVIGSIQSRVPIEAASRVCRTHYRNQGPRRRSRQARPGDRHARRSTNRKPRSHRRRASWPRRKAESHRATADENRFSALFARGSVTASERDAAEAAYRGAAGKSRTGASGGRCGARGIGVCDRPRAR